MIAPVSIFVYNRYEHAVKTISSLMDNTLAKETDVYIFSDGPKNQGDLVKINRIRDYLKQIEKGNAFKSITIIESDVNKGLANSIISGVTSVIKKYGRIIVIEDDCVSSRDFLSFMNKCLDYYEDNNRVWSIGGYTVNINFPTDYFYDVYVMGRTCSYAWATWLKNWEKVDWDVKDYNIFRRNLTIRRKFNEFGEDRAKMLDLQQIGKKNSWAIRFCYAMFKHKQFTIYPCHTKIQNIGYDVGTHVNGKSGSFDVKITEYGETTKLINDIEINKEIKKQFVRYFKRNKFKLFVSYLLNVLFSTKKLNNSHKSK